MITMALAAAALTGGVNSSSYAADEMAMYTLNPVVVTATRTEKLDIDVPATTTVITDQQIEEAGYKNVFDAIENQVGLSSTGYGDAGQDFGFSSGRTIIRGYDRGTLVMLDGIPMNLKNYNSLDGIPLSAVKKIEIIKGASGTLYGAEAMGGVVNIITKTPGEKPSTVIKGTVGNYYNDYGVTYSGDNLLLSFSKEYNDAVNHSNAYPDWSKSYDWRLGKSQKSRTFISAKLTDEIGANFMYQDGKNTRWAENKKSTYNYLHEDKRMVAGLHYSGKENGVKATIGYNYRQVDGQDYGKKTRLQSAADLKSYIADVQKEWTFGKDTLIAGYSFKREDYKGLYYTTTDDHRDSHSIYLSYDHKFNDKFSATVGLRGEKINDPYKDQNVLNPQFQTLYKINDTTSWYINIGRAFQMPTVDAYYNKGKFIAATGSLDPEKGWTYETGIKKLLNDKSEVKLAVYHMDFQNKFGWSDKDPITQEQHAINKGDFRNTGVEVEYNNAVSSHWKYSLGLGFSNPETKAPGSVWTQDSAKRDCSASLTYSANKINSTLTYKYLGDREIYSSTKRQVPSRIRLSWNTNYDITRNDTISLTLNNLLGHENYANKYGNLELPYNWRLSYSHKF